jgi:hypothetical protein
MIEARAQRHGPVIVACVPISSLHHRYQLSNRLWDNTLRGDNGQARGGTEEGKEGSLFDEKPGGDEDVSEEKQYQNMMGEEGGGGHRVDADTTEICMYAMYDASFACMHASMPACTLSLYHAMMEQIGRRS